MLPVLVFVAFYPFMNLKKRIERISRLKTILESLDGVNLKKRIESQPLFQSDKADKPRENLKKRIERWDQVLVKYRCYWVGNLKTTAQKFTSLFS